MQSRSRKYRATKRKVGFTLVELLVVISIIALLLAILLPALGKARQVAQGIYCQANLRTIGFGILMYAGDHDGQLMSYDVVRGDGTIDGCNNAWWAKTLPYMGQNLLKDRDTIADYFKCPSQKFKTGGRTGGAGGIEECHYGVSWSGLEGGLFMWTNLMHKIITRSAHLGHIRRTSDIFMLMDVAAVFQFGQWWDSDVVYNPYPNRQQNSRLNIDSDGDGIFDLDPSGRDLHEPDLHWVGADMRHYKKRPNLGLNVVFLDGRVERVKAKEFNERKHWVW